MTGRPDIDAAAEWAAHKRAERWAAVAMVVELLAWGVVVSAVVVTVAVAVFGGVR